MRALALVLLALAACWPSRLPPARWALGGAAGACMVAAVWHATFEGRSNGWAAIAVVAASVAAVALLPQLPGTARALRVHWHGWRWLMLVGVAAAVYGCVPETDQMREVGVVLVAGALAEWLLRQPLPPAAFTAAWGLVAWSAMFGATGRPSALIGGLFALVAPLAAAVVAPRRASVAVWVGVTWGATALVVARTGGIATTTGPAVRAAVLGAVVAVAISAALWSRARPRRSAG